MDDSGFSAEAKPGAEEFLTVVIPAFNEARRIGPTLDAWARVIATEEHAYGLLVVDDGSSDLTAAVVERAAVTNPRIRLLRLPRNQGKGAALVAGIRAATGRYVCYTDADLPVDPAMLPAFVRFLAEDRADLVIAARTRCQPPLQVPFTRRLASALFRWLVRVVVLPEIRDSQCGFKVFDRRAVVPLLDEVGSQRFAFDVEFVRIALDAELRVLQVPVRIVHRPGSTVRLLRDGLAMVWDLFQIAGRSRARRRARGRWSTAV